MAKKTTEILSAIIELLSPLPSDERQRVIQAAFLLLGESPLAASPKEKLDPFAGGGGIDLPAKAKLWAKQNGITSDMLDQVFHLTDGMAEVIADIPGKSQREQTINAYILAGLSQFLGTGEPKFADEFGRSICKTAGCFSGTNHATYLKDRGNDFTGNRESGWTLTSPGLKHAAALVKSLTGTPT